MSRISYIHDSVFILLICFFFGGTSLMAQKRDSLKVTVQVKQKDRDNGIQGADIRLNDGNINEPTDANGISIFYVDSIRYDRQNVKIEAQHPDYYMQEPIRRNIGNVNDFKIEMRLKLIVSGQVINQNPNTPVTGAYVTIYESEDRTHNVDSITTNSNGVYYTKFDVPDGTKIDVFVKKDGFQQNSVLAKRAYPGDEVDLSLIPLNEDNSGGTVAKPLPNLKGVIFEKKSEDKLSDIIITDETRSLRAITDTSGQYTLNKLDPDWKELELLVESQKIGKFPFRRYQYILTKPRRKQSQSVGLDGQINLGLRKNIIINQDRWILTAGLMLLGGISKGIAHLTYCSYENDPRNFRGYTTARTFDDISTVFFSLSGLSFTVNLLFLNQRPVTSKVALGIK